MAGLSEATIRELAGFRPAQGVVTSCYLDVDGRRYPRRAEYEAELERLLRRVRHRVNGEAPPGQDLQRIERHVHDGVDRSRTRGLAMFACGPAGFWQALALPVPVRSQLVVGHAPAVGQLESALHRYEPIGVLLVDRQHVRVLVFELGELTEYAETVDELFRDVDVRDEKARGQMEGKVEDRDQQHVRRAADAAFRVYADHPFSHLLVGAPAPLLGALEAALHPYLQERLRDRLTIAVTDPVEAIREVALAAEAEIERDRERALLADLRERLARDDRAVAGLADVLPALGEHRVDTLVVSSGYRAPGWSCSSCHRLAVVGPRCPRCQGELRKEEDVVAAAIDDALTQSARVEVCDASADLDVVGRIGALLRY